MLLFFFNDTATTEIYTLSLHDALPICSSPSSGSATAAWWWPARPRSSRRSEEHTSELQSQSILVCRLLLEKKKTKKRFSQLPNLPTSLYSASKDLLPGSCYTVWLPAKT